MGYWEYWDYYQRRKAAKPKGGIKAKSKRGAFGESWWAKRWNQVLESFNLGARLTRGRSYARGGYVLSIEVERGEVKAKVQGSMSKPYQISIELKTLTDAEWKNLAEAFSHQAIYAAKLLAGEMPPEIEEVFAAQKLSLFPARGGDLHTNCSCPDWSNPCKHIAAVYYLLGEEFDRDPFLLFKLRGKDRDEFISMLETNVGRTPKPAKALTERPPQPLPSKAELFWQEALLPDDFFGEVQVPPMPAGLLRRLGDLPFWRGETDLVESLTAGYEAAANRGMDVFVGK